MPPLGLNELLPVALGLLADERPQILVELLHPIGVLGHLDLDLVIGRVVVAQQVGSLGAQLEDLLEHLDVARAGAPLVLDPDLMPGRLVVAVVHDGDELRIGHAHEIDVARALQRRVLEPLVGHARELLARQRHARGVLADVLLELNAQVGELLLDGLELLALLRRKGHAGPAEVAKHVLQHPLLLAPDPRLGVGEGANGAVEVLVRLQVDEPVGHVLLGPLAGGPLLGIGRDVRHEHHHVRVELEAGEHVVQRADRVGERALAIGDRHDVRDGRVGPQQRLARG